MRWLPSRKRNKRRDTDWDFFDGYPPNLRMRKLKDGVWETRAATEEETREFKAREAEFISKTTPSAGAVLAPGGKVPRVA